MASQLPPDKSANQPVISHAKIAQISMEIVGVVANLPSASGDWALNQKAVKILNKTRCSLSKYLQVSLASHAF